MLEIVGLGKACEIAKRDLETNIDHMKSMRNRLQEKLTDRLEEIRFNGHPVKRLPNTLSVSFHGIEADSILAAVDEIAVSPGAACHSDSVNVSAVLTAMHVPVEYAMGTIRFSTGRMTTVEEIDRAVEMLAKQIPQIKKNRGGRTG